MAESTAKKVGIKTSEFWIALLAPFLGGVVIGVGELFNISIPHETIYTMTGTALAYVFQRGWVKSASAKADAGTTPPAA